jgi:hypothetical protein
MESKHANNCRGAPNFLLIQGCAVTIARRPGLLYCEVGRANTTAALARWASDILCTTVDVKSNDIMYELTLMLGSIGIPQVSSLK